MQNRSRLFFASIFAGLLWNAGSAVAAPDLAVGTANGKPGDVVKVGLNYTAGGNVAAMDFEIKYDSAKLTPGTREAVAGFPNQVSANAATPGTLKVLVKTNDDGAKILPIPSASPFVTIPFTIAANAVAGDVVLTVANVTMSDNAVSPAVVNPTSVTNGKVTVGGDPVQTVPNVVGKSQAEAENTLKDMGLTVVIQEVDSDQPKGTVLGTIPEAGQPIPADKKVTLKISKGVPQPTVPSVVGKSQAEAENTLKNMGLTVVIQEEVNNQPKGTVLGTIPEAGQPIPADKKVTLRVSKGPDVTPPPAGAAAVPTLSEWALALLVLAIGTVVWMRKSQSLS